MKTRDAGFVAGAAVGLALLVLVASAATWNQIAPESYAAARAALGAP